MFKKIIAGTILAAFIGILVWGAVIRTNAKTGSETSRVQGVSGAVVEPRSGTGRGGGGGRGGQFASGQSALLTSESDALPAAEWQSLAGTVASVDTEGVTVELTEGTQVLISGRAWRFAQEQGFSLAPGMVVTLAGFWEDKDFEIAEIHTADGLSVALRSEDGRPLWAGRGRIGGSASQF